MPHINEMLPSKYLKKEDIDVPKLVTIKSLDTADVSMENEPPKMRYTLWFQEFERPLVLNTTNIHATAQACGSEHSEHWIGKKVVLYVDPNVTMAGKLVGGVRVRAPKQGQPTQTTQPPPPALDDDVPW